MKFLVGKPRISLQTFFLSIPVVIEQLGVDLDVLLSDQDQSGCLRKHHNLGDAVWSFTAAVDKSAIPTALRRSIYTHLLLPILKVDHVGSFGSVKAVLKMKSPFL